MSYVLTLVSGKGGTGKTVISLALAQLLQAGGKRVAIYDADAATRGLTHYVSTHVDTSKPGLAEAETPDMAQVVRLKSSSDQITIYPIVGSLDASAPEPDVTTAQTNLMAVLKRDTSRFDYQIVDLQAGITPMLDAVFGITDATLVVSEADPVSIAAVTYLRRHLDRVGRKRVFGLVNRALPEEESYFESLTDYAREVDWAGVVPLDSDVRRSFFRRELPLRRESGDPFGLSLTDVLLQMGSPLSDEAQRARMWLQAKDQSPTEDYEQLTAYRDNLEREIGRHRLRSEQIRFVTSIAASTAALLVGVAATLAAQETIPVLAGIVGGGIGALGAAVSVAYGRFRSATSDQLEIDKLRRELDRVDEQVQTFDVRNRRLPSSLQGPSQSAVI